jgi:phage tail-like protein
MADLVGDGPFGRWIAAEFDDESGEIKISVDTGAVTTEWGETLRIVHSPVGWPVSSLGGTPVYDGDRTDLGAAGGLVEHAPHGEGWHYYSLFAQDGDVWTRLDSCDVLNVGDYAYGSRLWGYLPEWYRETDEYGVLEAYLRAVGAEFDKVRTLLQTRNYVWDPHKVSARLLPQVCAHLGAAYESALGPHRTKALLSAHVELFRSKGTLHGIETYLRLLTGQSVACSVGKNLLLTDEDSTGWEAASWEVFEDDSLVPDTSDGLDPLWVGDTGRPFLRYTFLGGTRDGDNPPGMFLGGVAGWNWQFNPARRYDIRMAVPVSALGEYRFSFNARSSAGDTTMTPVVTWLDPRGFPLSTEELDPILIATTGEDPATPHATDWFVADEDATHAVVALLVPGDLDEGETFDVWDVMLVDRAYRPFGRSESLDDPDLTYETPRKIWITIIPQRVNYVSNSVPTTDTERWFTTIPTTYAALPTAYPTYADIPLDEDDYDDLAAEFDTLTPDTTLSFSTSGGAHLALAPVGSSGPFTLEAFNSLFPVLGEGPMSARVDMRATGVGMSAQVGIRWFSTGDASSVISTTWGIASEADDAEYGEFLCLNASPPEGASHGAIVIRGVCPTVNELRFRLAMVEHQATPGDYFDGSFSDGITGDFFFAGPEHLSISGYSENHELALVRVEQVAPSLAPLGREVGIQLLEDSV